MRHQVRSKVGQNTSLSLYIISLHGSFFTFAFLLSKLLQTEPCGPNLLIPRDRVTF